MAAQPMPNVHDRGGRPGAGPIDRSERDYTIWEKRTDALMGLLSSPNRRIFTGDELRRAIESLPLDRYEGLSYYERWIVAIEALLVEKGVLTTAEIDRKVADRAAARAG